VDNETANSFVREALRMRHFDHPHVMKLIGICWAMEANFLSVDLFQLASGPLILLPYTELGDLRGYLRDKRRYSLSSGNPYVIISNVSCNYVCSHGMMSYIKLTLQISTDTNDKEDECLIPVGQLVKFGYQIAIGMEYVSKQGIVHRDLATRNCMCVGKYLPETYSFIQITIGCFCCRLTWDMNIKVSDFGLARMLEEGKDYYRMGQGSALPIRWMAPESIADLLFTTESDVWAYGVTLWEIFSFATIPYAGLSNSDILSYIQSGKRLPKPNVCPDDVHDTMQNCWKLNATDRPGFGEIASEMELILSYQKSYVELLPDL
jgi:serine/threonine protein kinase